LYVFIKIKNKTILEIDLFKKKPHERIRTAAEVAAEAAVL
jgi:hypothetical protein